MAIANILIIEDDPYISELIGLYLKREGFGFEVAANGEEGIELFLSETPDLVILDLMLPGLDGFAVCKQIRSQRSTPIIILTGKGESYDKLKGFELGADDYLVKPFDPKELLARIKAVMRRLKPGFAREPIKYADLVIDLDRYIVQCGRTEMTLPPKEMELLHTLASMPNRVLTREQLLDRVWGYDFEGDPRTVDVHIKRIREKIGSTEHYRIDTIRGVGYKFEVSGA
ncbi:response regulator transcription factor [Cohnella thailandensis]|uniref:Response regulator transcription factor n=1 Tax=Cohnella thailandensis TaxID=557557 RepID=A0A841SND1_9BACL|nr:response regulator transcription factor [Cohnella thailandensis]MBB6633963.1 response regulator transcription factor [Cohnella thailandensis]MBP1972646.1 DNA-binding response OmpR family regulator [Cohnella thailandensis]